METKSRYQVIGELEAQKRELIKQKSDLREKFVLKVRDEIIVDAIMSGQNIIVADTNLHPKHEENLSRMAKNFGSNPQTEFEVKDFTNVPIAECIKNDLNRLESVGEKVIRQMHSQFITRPSDIREFRKGVPLAVICDIDGTLALFDGLRSPYDTGKCEGDIVNKGLRLILQQLRPEVKVILVSGRSEEFRKQTENWLLNNYIYYDALFMRAKEDKRPDDIIKEEIYQREIEPKYDILIVFDDRPRVIRKWKELGLRVADVGNGIEF